MNEEYVFKRVCDVIIDSPEFIGSKVYKDDILELLGFDSMSVLDLDQRIVDEFGLSKDIDISIYSAVQNIVDEVMAQY